MSKASVNATIAFFFDFSSKRLALICFFLFLVFEEQLHLFFFDSSLLLELPGRLPQQLLGMQLVCDST